MPVCGDASAPGVPAARGVVTPAAGLGMLDAGGLGSGGMPTRGVALVPATRRLADGNGRGRAGVSTGAGTPAVAAASTTALVSLPETRCASKSCSRVTAAARMSASSCPAPSSSPLDALPAKHLEGVAHMLQSTASIGADD